MGCCCDKSTKKDLKEPLIDTRNFAVVDIEQKSISKEDFKEIKCLGKGSYSKVLLVEKKDTGKLFAMKVLDKEQVTLKNQVDHTKTERLLLEKMDHPFIVKLKYAFQTNRSLYLVTEFMQGGELFYHLDRERFFSEERARFYLSEIILALEYIHNNNCIYRDLKPENILLNADGHIKLADFGLSKLVISKANARCYTICGTPDYLAPEILEDTGYDKSVDWWSMGVLFYEMITGLRPFSKDPKKELDISKYSEKIHIYPDTSEEAVSLIKALLQKNPKKRLGYGKEDAYQIKKHPFFKDVDWHKVLRKEYKPMFVPKIKNLNDLSNFDKIFTDEQLIASCNQGNILEGKSQRNEYEGFTYINPSSLLN